MDEPQTQPNPNARTVENALVTVIIRSLGRPSIRGALDSVARQTHRQIEVLVVDASGGKHPPLDHRCGEFLLRLIAGGRPLNRPQAANRGLDHAWGDWIIFLDDDDFFDPGHIANLLRTATRRQAAVAYAGTRLLDQHDQPIGVLNERFSRLKLCAGNFLQMGAVLFHRSLLWRGCRFDEQMLLYQDWDFWLQLSGHSDFAHSPELTNNWRILAGQSGAGTGPNADSGLQAEYTDRVQVKWRLLRERLFGFVRNTLRRSTAQISEGRPERAVKLLRRALAVAPNDPSLTNLLGVAQLRAGDVTGAWGALSDAHSLLPDSAAIYRNLQQVAQLRQRQAAGSAD